VSPNARKTIFYYFSIAITSTENFREFQPIVDSCGWQNSEVKCPFYRHRRLGEVVNEIWLS
jgi:hypothetical protein